MLLFLTLTHHHYGCRDVKCKPAIAIHFNLLQVCLSVPPFVFAVLFIPSLTTVSGYFCFSQYVGGFIRLNFDKFRVTAPFIKHSSVVTWYMGSGLKAQNMTGIGAQRKGLRAQGSEEWDQGSQGF